MQHHRLTHHEYTVLCKLDAEGPTQRGHVLTWFGRRTGKHGPRSVSGRDVLAALTTAGLVHVIPHITRTDPIDGSPRYASAVDLTPEGRKSLIAERVRRDRLPMPDRSSSAIIRAELGRER